MAVPSAPPLHSLPQAEIARAAECLRLGDLVGMPTETVYGLAGDATNDTACARIFAAKKRPHFNPLIAHMADIAMARRHVEFSPLAARLAAAFWPGPLTLVLPRRPDCALSYLTSAGLPTQAVRVPADDTALALITKFARPIAAPSANISGRLSPTTAHHVRSALGEKVAMILDAGPATIGIESTVIEVTADDTLSLLRPGGLPLETLERFMPVTAGAQTGPIQSPGMMDSHYAPNAALCLNVTDPAGYDAYLGFHTHFREQAGDLNLSREGSLTAAAANLFACLHQLDISASTIAVAPIPETGLGRAINDRLRRAAGPASAG